MDDTRIAEALAELEAGLLERDVAARVLLLGAVAGEHVLLIGPPGTAKSALARRLHRVLGNTRYFERLLTRFSVPEELFGPLSLRALEEDRYERQIQGYLPTAHVAFLDEVFKANSAILNALLTLLNEREFDNGSRRLRVPLVTLVGASNEVPDDEALRAFQDRFLLQVPVAPVGDAAFERLLSAPAPVEREAPPSAQLGREMLERVRERAQAVQLPPDVIEALRAVRVLLAQRAAAVSDRRWRKLGGLLQVQAASRGDRDVSRWDLWVLPWVLATREADRLALEAFFMDEVAQAPVLETTGLERAVQAFEGQLEIESSAPAHEDDGAAGKAALAASLGGGEAAALGSDAAQWRLHSERARARWSALHVLTRVEQVQGLIDDVDAALGRLRATARASMANAAAHPWLPPSWRAHMAGRHAGNEARVVALRERLERVAEGFASQPLRDDSASADGGEPPSLMPLESGPA